ncbi:Early nodulin-like protein 3 [Zostera marina]|uniref:Early nodulin-like protein 3 n=1 Tax=Zostera marina TaxID=29655 RepID=A0A0K9NQ00_ZOSMR|nr:Early nodulin-like protein 3 [Zostera marina]
MNSPAILISVTAFLALLLLLLPAFSLPFDVGDDSGWVVPNDHNDSRYNDWASTNRFITGDTLRFRYRKKDSLMVVGTKKEYRDCNTSQPLYFANNGDTVYKLNAPGTYYFISGILGHCQDGERMIVKVMNPLPGESSQTGTDRDFSDSSKITAVSVTISVVVAVVAAFLY